MNPLYRNDRQGELPDSWYVASADIPPFRPPLKGHLAVDVCIIGAGFTGLSAARHLAEKGLQVIVLDAHRVGFGASGRNGGQVWSGFNTPQRSLAKTYGAAHAGRLWDVTQEAKDDIRTLCKTYAPDAKYRPGIAEAAAKPSELDAMHRDAAYLQETYGYADIQTLDRNAMYELVKTKDYHGGNLDMGAGHIHPLRFVFALAQLAEAAGAQIFECSEVHHIAHGDPAEVRTGKGRIKASHVILAGNGYLTNIEKQVTNKILPVNSFICATEPLGDRAAEILTRDIAVSDSKFVLNYYRLSEDNRLLYGGRANYGIGFPKDMSSLLIDRLEAMFPQIKGVRIDHTWGGTIGVTATRMPAIQRVAPNIVSAAGYSGMGVAMSGMAGKVLAEAIAGQACRFDTLSDLNVPNFPGGTALRAPTLRLAMTWYALRDKLGL